MLHLQRKMEGFQLTGLTTDQLAHRTTVWEVAGSKTLDGTMLNN